MSAAYLFRLYPFSFYNPLLITVGILQLLALLQVCRLPVRVEGLLRKLGEYSYAIYLFEGLLLQRRNLWFGMLQTQILIDLAFILSSVAAGVLFWKSYQKLEGLIPWDRWIRF